MKQIQRWIADDGKIFDSQFECERYEKILNKVNTFLSTLPDVNKYNISNGSGYIQHEKGTYKKIEKIIVSLANEYFKPKEKFTKFNYYLGRVIDDSSIDCLNKLTYRLQSMKDDKEYGQPYFACHTNECKDIQVN